MSGKDDVDRINQLADRLQELCDEGEEIRQQIERLSERRAFWPERRAASEVMDKAHKKRSHASSSDDTVN